VVAVCVEGEGRWNGDGALGFVMNRSRAVTRAVTRAQPWGPPLGMGCERHVPGSRVVWRSVVGTWLCWCQPCGWHLW
jgi:hypothetical protein